MGYVSVEPAIQEKAFSFMALLPIGLLGLFLRHKIVSPRLAVYQSNLTEEQFKQANAAAAKLNDWIILSDRKDYFSAIKNVDWQWDGIKITAILKNGKLYLNSMVYPSTGSNPFTFGLNKRNKFELIRQYQSILKGENVIENTNKEIERREAMFWKESEWNVNNILKRIVGYGLSISFIGLSVYMITSGDVKAIGAGIVLIGLCLPYIFQDIKVIREKEKRK